MLQRARYSKQRILMTVAIGTTSPRTGHAARALWCACPRQERGRSHLTAKQTYCLMFVVCCLSLTVSDEPSVERFARSFLPLRRGGQAGSVYAIKPNPQSLNVSISCLGQYFDISTNKHGFTLVEQAMSKP